MQYCISNGTVKFSLCLSKHHTMKTYGGVAVQLHALLNSVLEDGE
jgi:hypothetical protein